jgi:hypothetical protein
MLLGFLLPIGSAWTKPKAAPIQVNEASSDLEKYTDVVRSLSPGEDLVEVQFKKRRGIHYARKNQSTLEVLAKSQKTGATVTFEIDKDDLLQSVQLNKSKEEESEEEAYKKVMKDILGP